MQPRVMVMAMDEGAARQRKQLYAIFIILNFISKEYNLNQL